MTDSQPLLVHLIFHPQSDSARELAMTVYQSLNDDSALPGLRIPTVFACEDGTEFPPVQINLAEAERSVFVVLIDDKMVIEPATVPTGRKIWSEFVGDLHAEVKDGKHRFIPVQLSESGFPLDERLAGTSFLRGHLQNKEELSGWLCRVLLVEISRFLDGDERGKSLPLRLFLSHAKQDIDEEPQVFNKIVEHLQITQPVEAWVDSAKIAGGSQFANEIEEGVIDSALLALVTRNYSSRSWCRNEMLIAKRNQCPLVVVDAQEGVEARTFPYSGNTPRIRWSESGAAAAVDLLLKETLRQKHARLVLERGKRKSDHVLTTSPEPTTVVRVPVEQTILYPDPPIGDEEAEELKTLGRRFLTPIQRAHEDRSLSGKTVLISISESNDSLGRGLIAEHMNSTLIEISRQLLVRGATLEYGGHLGDDGYTQVLFDMAQSYNATSGVRPAERIINDVGWPLPLEELPDEVRAKYQRQAIYRRISRPEGVENFDPQTFVEEPKFFPANSPERRYAWSRGMTAMRKFQAEESGAIARVVIGGKVGPTVTATREGEKKEKWYSGRIPGVIEEVLMSLRAGQPVFIVGAFGGAAKAVIDLLEGKERPDLTWDFQKNAPHAEEMRSIYQQQGQTWENYDEFSQFLSEMSVSGVAKLNRLSLDENRELMTTRDQSRIVELAVKGVLSSS